MEAVMIPRESGQLIAETSKDVKVHNDGVQKLAQVVCFKILYHGIFPFELNQVIMKISHLFKDKFFS